jgi:LuxR family transcriptional regulator, maltose regulon positive regulatory protein
MRKNNKPFIRLDMLVTVGAENAPVNPILVGSQSWYAWLADQQGFTYEGVAGHFNARRELRRGIGYWYGYRRREGKLRKVYLGKSVELTQECLEQASALLAGQIPFKRLLSNDNHDALITAVSMQSHETISPSLDLAEMPYLSLTKVKPPVLPQTFIPRPRLTQKINLPVTIICAPSGFGISTMVNEWRQSCGMPVAWVTLDQDDNHPLRFWLTVVTALQSVNPSFGQGWLSLLRTSSPTTISKVVVNLTNDMVKITDSPNTSQWIGLVLDHYHHIQNTEIHTSLQLLLDHIPQKLKLVIAGRTMPPFAISYLRAKGRLIELDIDDLRFTPEEGIEFLRQNTPGQPLAYGDMQTLIKRTEGWITGLVLATSALTQQEDRSKFMETFTGAHSLLREYFTESVLHQQSSEMQVFLIKTSILKHLTGPLCDAVTGQKSGAEVLDHLWEEKLFLERFEQPDWYRYHDLFAEMLQTQLQEQYPTEIRRLHRKAAKWYRARNAPVDAVFHLLASEDWEDAAALIESVALHELEQLGEDSRLLRWLQQLPEIVVQKHKTLLAVYIRLARITLPSTEVDNFLTRIEKNITYTSAEKQTSEMQETLAEIHRIRGLWATNNLETSEIPIGGEHDTEWQMLNDILQCYRDYRRDLIRAEEKTSALYETAQTRHHLYAILMAGGGCANLALSQGYLRRSEQLAQQVLRQAYELSGKLPEPASIALAALSGVYFMRNQVGQADQLLIRANEVDPNPASTNQPVTIAILRAKIQSAQGDNDAAFTTIQAIRELHTQRPSSIWLDQDLMAYQELFRLRQGDLSSAERLLSEAGEIELSPFSALVRAEILIEQNRSVAAEDIVNHFLNKYPDGFYMLPVMKARVILAIALFEQRKINQSRQVMAEAARLAAPEFFIRPFLDFGPKIVSLLSLVLHTENLNSGTQSFLKGILAMLGQENGAPKIYPRDEPAALAIAASISIRERQILQLICAGLSNREIAAQCSVSASTVKTHLENIYRKIGVSSRTQAIAQAQALGLV